MPHSRRTDRRTAQTTRSGPAPPEEVLSPRRLALDEGTEEAPGTPGEPAGFGVESSTSSTSDVDLASYSVPAGRTARLIEVALSLEGNGEATLHVNGINYGPYTGAVDVSLPFDGAFLPEGADLLVTHESTDGASTTTKASATIKEV